jgi:hypothetical protein
MDKVAGLRSAAVLRAHAALVVTLCAGCAATGPRSAAPSVPVSPAASHVEAVFRYQSRVASAVLDRYAYLEVEGGRDPDPTLMAADARMAEICRYLNEAALARVEKRAPRWDLKLKVLATAGDCERAAGEVERLLRTSVGEVATARL